VLLDDRYAPITSEIGFLMADPGTVADAMLAWWEKRLKPPPRAVREDVTGGSLGALLGSLLPLDRVIPRRNLLLPTDGPWTAALNNHWQGPDIRSTVGVLSRDLGTLGVTASAVVDDRRAEPPGRFGGTTFAVYTASLNPARGIWAINDGGRWVFEQTGSPLPFEREELYRRRRRIRDRFTPELLEEYCERFGIRLFDERFYAPGHRAILISTPDAVAHQETVTLEVAQAELGIVREGAATPIAR